MKVRMKECGPECILCCLVLEAEMALNLILLPPIKKEKSRVNKINNINSDCCCYCYDLSAYSVITATTVGFVSIKFVLVDVSVVPCYSLEEVLLRAYCTPVLLLLQHDVPSTHKGRTETTAGRQKAALGLSLGFSPNLHLDHNPHFQDFLSSTIDLGSFEVFQDVDLPFEGLDTIEEVESCEEHRPTSDSLSLERTQQFIEEMDIFIKEHEENYPMTPCMQSPDPKVSLQSSESVDDETKRSENQMIVNQQPNSIFENPSATPVSTLSPASSTATLVDFSPPSSVTSPKQHKYTNRKENTKGGRQKLAIKDKKERKKWQNVEAARRYRDKKRDQVNEYQLKSKELKKKNTNLKEKLREVENELSTMKKLMTELGMIKVVQK
ncbi:unnamed protein product [Lepeophtheirus salmonis]|uniref:(salmon louse) hypothetical protein n=1 Tax=Lepeophtheirus salmonis TaxID=72036 RepID=A0A7R8CUV7_LEPSM|nr:unnamed protein product [Lepeophtheirus salmonis]CAF2938066.1 unnamed protein product [Lepeophtheirus salmonis]